MRVTLERSLLADALLRAAAVADRKSTMPILANAVLTVEGGALTVAASDVAMTVTVSLPVLGATPGSISADAKQLAAVVKDIPGDSVSIAATDDGQAEIRAGKARYRLASLPTKDFPRLPVAPKLTAIDGAALARILERVSHAMLIGEETSRPQLCGVLVASLPGGGLRAVATDGHRLARADVKGDDVGFPATLIPGPAVGEIRRMLEAAPSASIGVDGQLVYVATERTLFAARLYDAKFPPYEQVLRDTHDSTMRCDRAALLGVVERVGRMTGTGGESRIKMEMSAEGLTCSASASDKGTGSEDLSIDWTGPALAIGIGHKIVADALKAAASEKVEMRLNGPLDAVEIVPVGDDSFRALLMPMRLT